MNKIKIIINPHIVKQKISRYLYGSFAEHLGRCIYEGTWVGENSDIENDGGIRLDTVNALKKIQLPVLRYPGGCFADNYHWMDGIGKRSQRPKRLNIWWNQVETNQFGTDEFMRFCRMIGTEPYLCVNVGSGTVEEARSWVEYCNSSQETTLVEMRRQNGHDEPYHVEFWGVGNENWVCGGNMRPEYYADLYRQYATYLRMAGENKIKLIACGSYFTTHHHWDERFLMAMKDKLHLVDYIALHLYSGNDSSDIDFSDEDYYRLMNELDGMDQSLARAGSLTQFYSSLGHPIRIILDEWGTWYKQAKVQNGLYQQNTMRDAIFTALNFHLFHNHASRLFMTNMAQTINVLQSLILTNGSQFVVTPTYYVYEMFMPHRDSQLIHCEVENSPILKLNQKPSISVSASKSIKNHNEIFLSIVNLDLSNDFNIEIKNMIGSEMTILEVKLLACNNVRDFNSFDDPKMVAPKILSIQNLEALSIPAHSVLTLTLKIK